MESLNKNLDVLAKEHPQLNSLLAKAANRKYLLYLWVFVIFLTVISYFNKGKLIDYTKIDPKLLQDPIQTETNRQQFSFKYKSNTYNVKPVAEYSLWGLVVSHNNISSIGDIYHDSSSVDTKDIAVIWGKNLESNDFHEVEFKSLSWACEYRFPYGIKFYGSCISNNHLITSDKKIRDLIDKIRVGDQVHVKGMLVNYQDERNPTLWRNTSTKRTDTKNGACEVIFVENIEILQRGTTVWYFLYSVGWWGIFLIPLISFVTLCIESFPSKKDLKD